MNIPSSIFLYINIAICLIYIALICIGYAKGLLYELASLLYTGFSLLVAWFVAPVLGKLYPITKFADLYAEGEIITKFINIDSYINTIIYFVLIFLILKVFYLILALFLKGMNKIPVIGKLNQILGAIAGIFNATLITLALSLLLSLPIFSNGDEVKKNTVFKYVEKYSSIILEKIALNLNVSDIQGSLDDLNVDEFRKELTNWLNSNNE